MTWTPEDDEPIPYIPANLRRATPKPAFIVADPSGRVHVVARMYVIRGIHAAEELLEGELGSLIPDWTLIEGYANNPDIRPRIDAAYETWNEEDQ